MIEGEYGWRRLTSRPARVSPVCSFSHGCSRRCICWRRGSGSIHSSRTPQRARSLAVAYVFLHLLPELAEGNQAVGEALDNAVPPTPLLELANFTVALLGFTVFYGLEARKRAR